MKITRITAIAAAVLAAFAIAGCTAQPASTPDASTSTSVTDTSTPAPTSSEVVTPTSSSALPPAPTSESTPAPEPAPAPVQEEPAPASEPITEYQEPSTTEAERAEWIDPDGNWMSPGTVQRALDHGIPWGEFVPGYLRCGTICGEIPTSGEVQSQYWATHQPELTTQAAEPWKDCPAPQYWINGTCYPSPAAASAAGENVGD